MNLRGVLIDVALDCAQSLNLDQKANYRSNTLILDML